MNVNKNDSILSVIQESIIESVQERKKRTFSFKNYFKGKPKFFLLFLFRILGVSCFFVIFEIAFFTVMIRTGNIFYELWILQASVVLGYIVFIYCSLFSSKLKILKAFKIMTSLAILAVISFLLLVVIIYFESLTTLPIVLSLFLVYYFINLRLTIKSNGITLSKIKVKTMALIFLIFASCAGILTIMTFMPNTIEIEPKTESEIIFWCGSNQLPDDSDVLEMCKKNNIGFMPTITNNLVGNNETMQAYKNIIAHELNLHFAIGGDSCFFGNIDNAQEFPTIYRNVRQWFINEGIMDSPYVASFSIDAEPPREYTENMDKKNTVDTIDYGSSNYPSQDEIDDATEAIVEFTDMIKVDEKECGMIRAAQLLDTSDDDDDLSLFRRNLYTLDVEWDFTISMLYRTNELQDDENDAPPPKYLTSSLSLFFGAMIEGTKYTNSELSFYQNVALEQNPGDTNADEQYIFVGNFEKEFEDTEYIKEKKFLKDLDICRHFGEEKVFFYELKGFLSHYGWEGVEELGLHNQQKDKWNLKYNNSKSMAFFLFYCGLIIIDLFAFFERDLT